VFAAVFTCRSSRRAFRSRCRRPRFSSRVTSPHSRPPAASPHHDAGDGRGRRVESSVDAMRVARS
jgi:hypothetical protein